MDSKIFKSLFTLDVPLEKFKRGQIRATIESHFLKFQVMPPVSHESLFRFASLLIEENRWEERYRAFIMVCCGNAIWRTVVGAIPFNRRIFLLPQCLRNTAYCKAEKDDLGLLCGECGNCSISGFLREAENLGYVALVTEGTTITTRLIESGKVDAVIGVGCMEVLQKMFASVSKYAIPGIGIPLVTCGCVSTRPDAEWIKQEVYNYREDPSIRLLNLNYLRNKSSSIFGEEQLTRILGTPKNKTEQIAFESLLSGGQRLRPFLAVLAYEAFVHEPDPVVVNMLALSVECFHKASLVHDDIEDNDLSRYGKETIHARYGIPVATNIGDLLIGEGYRLLSQANLEPNVALECIKIVSEGHRAMSVGQGTELMARNSDKILPFEDVLKIFENKTAAAFKVSLLVGAIAGGAERDALNLLDQFSNLIGVAYQLKDDLEDFTTEEDTDSFQTHSALISLLAGIAKEEDPGKLVEALHMKDAATLYFLIGKYSIREQSTALLKDLLTKINSCLGNVQNLRLKLALNEIVGKTFRDYI